MPDILMALKGAGRIILSRVIGFIIFLVLIWILNLMTYYVHNNTLSAIVSFLNSNLLLIIIFTLIFIIADIFYYLWFPLDLPAPLLSAFGTVLLIRFIFNIIIFVLSLIGITLNLPLEMIYIIIAVIAFIIVLIVGYARIIGGAARRRRHMHEHKHEPEYVHKKKEE